MTSRPSAGIQRQPQRSSSGTGTLQRPSSTHRSLSQQYPSSAGVGARRNENYVDLTDGADNTSTRYSTPRNGSRLKTEFSKDSKSPALRLDSPKALEALPESLSDPISRGPPKPHSNEDGHHHPTQFISSVQGLEKVPGQNLMPMPMPRRPGQHSQVLRKSRRVTVGGSLKKEARPKPYTLEVPSIAPHYSPNGKLLPQTRYISAADLRAGHTDFFPWTGDHPEDRFNDNVIRQGYFDKLQHSQNETGTAKAAIFTPLKHKTGLQTLSSLFTSVLAHRRNHGLITSPPTFKPPPRVTLTDTKRESWLRDLANPSISLRRLSRTIPHGIRGKVLLEQCLSKKIPTERAVWLAKCVGANEIRAFKRKGATGTFAMGGEAKWIRDWTIFVEQFVESVMGSCGEKEWKARVSYA
jgi:mediator of RNA polymerase II transcription subunit 12